MKNDENNNSYKTMDNLFSSQRDFIVIGLCGLTGSGSTEVANILQKDFDDLGLPLPSNCPNDVLIGDDYSNESFSDDDPELMRARHEYRILYSYAAKNWNKFYRIKVSALITAHILENDGTGESIEMFKNFLKNLRNFSDQNDQMTEINKSCEEFFKKKMLFDFEDWFNMEGISVEDLLKQDQHTLSESKKLAVTIVSDKKRRRHIAKNVKDFKDETRNPNEHELYYGESKPIKYQLNENKIYIENQDLYKLFRYYGTQRKEKRGLDNPVLYWILKQYIFEFLPMTVSEMWKSLAKLSEGLPNLAMQQLGINLRINRRPFDATNIIFEKNGYEIIAEDINLAIKLLGTYQQKWYDNLDDNQLEELGQYAHEHILVVIDSIKNPFESMYLKRRYSNYYLIGVCTEEIERERRLLKDKGFSQSDIKEIDQIERLTEFKKEYKKDKNDDIGLPVQRLIEKIKSKEYLYHELPFIFQNVERCLDAADIFINNAYDSKTSRLRLKKVLLRYICLIMYPGLVLPTPVEHCMQTAYTAKLNSGCISRQVGAVVTDSRFHILSTGWNQQPEGQLPCSYRDLCELCMDFAPNAYSDYENDKNFHGVIKEQVLTEYASEGKPLGKQGRLPIFCFKDIYNHIKGEENQVHTRSLHGEETAFLNLGPSGKEQAKGGCLFTTSSPCELCAKKAMFMGISRIYYVEPYSGISAAQVLHAGLREKRPKLILLTGAVGRAYMQLYTPLMPLKDEHEMWIGKETAKMLFPNSDSEKPNDSRPPEQQNVSTSAEEAAQSRSEDGG
ncbi:MAG: hypothetical protein J1E98_13790 [Lachnospiraceae bacterium]|nr:hypothetical protein [Lachnospiraceae bacterium]